MNYDSAVELVKSSTPVVELLAHINKKISEAAHAGKTSVTIDVEKYDVSTVKVVKMELAEEGFRLSGLGWFKLTIHFEPKTE